MSEHEAKAQSVRNRLLNLAKAKGENYNLILLRYGIERLLFRLSRTKHVERFVLKGAMLYYLWETKTVRPTKDLDLAGFGKIDEQELRAIFREVCSVQDLDDAVTFDAGSLTIEEIREGEAYEGFRVKIPGSLGTASLNVLVDIGIGDAITPDPRKMKFPTLLDLQAPVIQAYPLETVVAEKFDAICALGMRNSRMKDYFDLWTITRNQEFDGATLVKAIRATLERRRRAIPKEMPVGLRNEFGEDATKQTQWSAFIRRAVQDAETAPLPEIIDDLHSFFNPLVQALGHEIEYKAVWRDQQWDRVEG